MAFIATGFGTVDLDRLPSEALQEVATEFHLEGDPKNAVREYILHGTYARARPVFDSLARAAQSAGIADCVCLK